MYLIVHEDGICGPSPHMHSLDRGAHNLGLEEEEAVRVHHLRGALQRILVIVHFTDESMDEIVDRPDSTKDKGKQNGGDDLPQIEMQPRGHQLSSSS